MACKRSAVRSRLAPPAFAGYACFGSASPLVAKGAASQPEGRRRASADPSQATPASARQALSERRFPRRSRKGEDGPRQTPVVGKALRCSLIGEAGQRHEIPLYPRKPRFRTFLCRYYRRPARATSEAQCGRGPPYLDIQTLALENLCRVQR